MSISNKQTMYEAICHAQSDEVHPEDYGFDDNDYEALWRAVQITGHLAMINKDNSIFLDVEKRPVYLFKECGFDTPKQLQLVWRDAKRAIELFADSIGVEL